MPVLHEYRIALPITLEEARIGQLYSVCERSKLETGGGEGIEVVNNEPFDKYEIVGGPGQYTHKLVYLSEKVPSFIRMLAPSGSLEIHEKAWNVYPNCYTEYSNPYMKENFHITIHTLFKEGYSNDDNVFNLDEGKLAQRQVEVIDIVNDKCDPRDYVAEQDPKLVKSSATDRGPFTTQDWYKTTTPILTCYKLYDVEFKWWGLQTKVETIIIKAVRRLLFTFNRQMYCWIDKHHGMTMEQIRDWEKKTKTELDKLRSSGEVRGLAEK